MIDIAIHNIQIASQIYNTQREYYNDNELTMMQYLIKLVVSLQITGGRNDKANNQYGLWNREHINREGGLIINKHGSNNGDKDKEEEDEVNRPHQRRRVDEADNEDAGEVLDVPRVIDFEAFALN